MLLSPGPEALAQSRNWTVAPSIGLRETYTDNVSLAAVPEHGEFVTGISPSVSVAGRGSRFSANLNYTGDLLLYSRSRDQDRLANTLSATGNLEAVERFFFVDAQANVGQTYASPFGPRPSDIATTTSNRTEARTLSVSPYVRSQTPGGYSYEVRNRNTWTSTDNAGLARTRNEEWSSHLAGPSGLFSWAIDANKTDLTFDDPVGHPERESSAVRGRLFFQPDPEVRLYASAGRESNNFVLQETRYNKTYGYGLLWRPTPVTSAAFDWERRFFGVSKVASFEHRTPLSAWRLSYSKNVSNFQQQLLRLPPGNTVLLLNEIFRARIPDPLERVAAIAQFLRATGTPLFLTNSLAFFTEQVFLEERLEGSFAILGVRNSVTFTAFRARSTALSDQPASLPTELFPVSGDRIDQRGFGVNVSHRVTSFTSAGVSANRASARSERTGIESHSDFLAVNLTHTLSPKTNVFEGLSYSRFEGASGPASHARSVFAGLLHRF